MRWRLQLALVALLLATGALLAAEPAEPQVDKQETHAADQSDFEVVSLQGRVVWLAEALKRRFDIQTDADAEHAQVALETADGHLWPIVKDGRGRGFWLDERIRDVDMQLMVRRYPGSPMIQVIRVYTIKPDGKYELDYWCDVCAIPMYELKPCECCQGETRIRERKVEKE